jgi:serine/threonine protein kinase
MDANTDFDLFRGNTPTHHDKIKFINQGTYGCIFRPAINCKGKLLTSSFVTKIQSEKENSDKETKIGYKIKKIQGYSKYFAPILKTCNVSIANIKNDEIKKCDFINEKTTKIISNKMKYVGDKTLFEYFLSIFTPLKNSNGTPFNSSTKLPVTISNDAPLERPILNLHGYKENPDKIQDVIFDCYLHILEGIKLLHQNNIIHYDLKENNIMFDEQYQYPIIIDFGLSFENTKLNEYEDLLEAFYVYAPEYKPWCFEIHVISFILRNIDEKDLNEPISLSLLNPVVADFLKKNTMFKYFKKSDDYKHYENGLKEFLNQYSELSYIDLISELIKYNYSWDNYSLAIIIFYSIYTLRLDETYSMNILLKLLKQIIFSTPDTRFTIQDTMEKVISIYDEFT